MDRMMMKSVQTHHCTRGLETAKQIADGLIGRQGTSQETQFIVWHFHIDDLTRLREWLDSEGEYGILPLDYPDTQQHPFFVKFAADSAMNDQLFSNVSHFMTSCLEPYLSPGGLIDKSQGLLNTSTCTIHPSWVCIQARLPASHAFNAIPPSSTILVFTRGNLPRLLCTLGLLEEDQYSPGLADVLWQSLAKLTSNIL